MTDKMLRHPGDPFPALTEMDVTVIALPVDDDATMQQLTAVAASWMRAATAAGYDT